MIQYILECIAFQLVFLIIYDFFLKRETFFQWNRLYLIGTYVLSMVLPWVKIEALKTTVPEQYYAYSDLLWNANTVSATVTYSEVPSFNLSWQEGILYGGMLVATVYFGYKLFQIYKLRNEGAIQRFPNFTQIVVKNSELAFSFFKSIFLGDKVIQREHQSIIQHELVHIEQRHSWDLLFFELMRIMGWFNPLVYVYQNRVSELHEFIADSKVVKTDKKEQYEFLLSQIFQTENISFVNQFFKTSLIKKRIKMLQRKKSKKVWQLKYLLLVPLVLGMILYTSSEAQETDEIAQEQTFSDAELIDKINAEIDNGVNEFGSIGALYFNSPLMEKDWSEEIILSKEEYFKSKILTRRNRIEMYDDMNKKGMIIDGLSEMKNKILEKPLPSTTRYKSYVKYIKAYQILDQNLKYSINVFKQDIALIDRKEGYSQESFVLTVENTRDLTGKELRAFNNKLTEVFERGDSQYKNIVLTDSEYAFRVETNNENGELGTHLRNITFPINDKSQGKKETIRVGNVQNLTPDEEKLIFNRLKIISGLSEDWELMVTDSDKESYIKYLPSNEGSFITGPNGEAIQAQQIMNNKPSVEEQKATEDFVSSVNRKKYDQLVAERKRLLKSTNEKNPVIVNLDQQIQGLKQSIEGKSHVKMESKDDSTAKYNQLLAERKRLLKSSNEKNPAIVNLDQQIKGLRKAVFGDGETVPFGKVEEVPIFPGCEGEKDKRECFQKNMQQHIGDKLRYPQEAQEKGIQGRVSILFTISESGEINNIKTRGPHKLLEEEAERIISLLPKMKPGKHKGKLVNVPYSIPISFKLGVNEVQSHKSLNLDTMMDTPPLYIIDGEESTKEVMNYMPPKDIESINVLKGEYAVNIYGEKGKNGVMVVTTKKNQNNVEESNEVYRADTNTMSVTATATTENAAKIISGKVTDGMMGLPGATIGIEGAERGVISDFDGKFEIKAKKGDVILIQYIGLPILKFTVTDEESYQITKKK